MVPGTIWPGYPGLVVSAPGRLTASTGAAGGLSSTTSSAATISVTTG
jgi:hypothetical protein